MDGEERCAGSDLHCNKGRLVRKRDDYLLLLAQYSSSFRPDVKQKIHFAGNGAKSLHLSVNASLTKLRTSYIDLLYIHWWDFETSIKEVMDNLHALVLQRKILYIVSISPRHIDHRMNSCILRALLIPQPGLYLKPTSMPWITARRLFVYTKAIGT